MQKNKITDNDYEKISLDGHPLEKVADSFNVTKQAIHSGLTLRPRLHEIWRENREKKREEERKYKLEKTKSLESICSIIEQVVEKKNRLNSSVEQSAYKNTFDVLKNKKRRSLTFDRIYNIFKAYHDSKERRENASLQKLSYRTGEKINTISCLLREEKLKTLTRPYRKQKTHISKKIERTINRALETRLSGHTIGNVMGLSKESINNRVSKKREVEQDLTRGIKIYEAIDLGFINSEISELTGLNEKIVLRILKNRTALEEEIKKSFEYIFEKKFKKPYL